MTDTTASNGQAAADSIGTTANAPEGSTGASVSSAQTTGNGPDAAAIESFFDPASIADNPQLMAAYKQMQGSYTKRMQEYAKHRPKVEAYDRFERDPVGTMRQLAAQYGLQVVERGQEQSQEQEFKSWDDVQQHFFKEFEKKYLNPVVNEVKSLKKQSIESHLDSKFSDWRTYEPEMMEKLREHPSLVNDPDTLYRISVPQEVWEARATKAAMQKLKGATEHAQVAGGSSTAKQTSQAPTGPMTFDQAVKFAQQKLQQQGIRRPAG
jgi:hypothetical protein